MPVIELWHWIVTDRVSGRRYVTKYLMTEASALNFDPCAERLPESQELRPLHQATRTSHIGRQSEPVAARVNRG